MTPTTETPYFSIKDLEYITGVQPFSADLSRINVIMGANGAGKSSLLKAIASLFVSRGLESKPVYIEGGRRTEIDINFGLDSSSINFYTNPAAKEQEYLNNRTSTLFIRMRSALRLLRALEQSRKAKHSDDVQAWVDTGKIGEPPARPRMPFDQFISIFENIFSDLKIVPTSDNQVYIEKGGKIYPASSMSDGEKQIFMLVADLLSFKGKNQVFLVDEPELNLHPILAEQFWSLVEREIDDAIFVYATHSLSFAMRESVEQVHLLGFGHLSSDDLSLHNNQLRPFLGSFPIFKETGKYLLVEGSDTSIDTALYRWLLGRDDISVIAVGGSAEVSLAAERTGLWSKLSQFVTVTGVIDRDFKCNIRDFHNCTVLPFHEAESILSHPDIVLKLRACLGNHESLISRDEIIDRIVSEASKRLIYVAVQRTFKRLSINLSVSVDRSLISGVKDADAAVSLVATWSRVESEKVAILSDSSKVQGIFYEEYNACTSAISNRDVDAILRIFEGKQLLSKMHGLAGCPSPF